MKLAWFVCIVLFLIIFGQIAAYYEKLPEIVAIHFDIEGKADGMASKQVFIMFYIALVALLSLSFCGLAALLPKVPPAFINMPNKDYWLAEERKKESLAKIMRQMFWMNNITILFVIFVMEIIFQTNLTKTNQLNIDFFIILIIYIIFNIAWVVNFYRAFKKTW